MHTKVNPTGNKKNQMQVFPSVCQSGQLKTKIYIAVSEKVSSI